MTISEMSPLLRPSQERVSGTPPAEVAGPLSRAWRTLFFLLAILLPLGLLFNLFGEIRTGIQADLDRTDRDRVSLLMQEFIRDSDRSAILRDAFDRWTRESSTALRGKPLAPDTARLLLRSLQRRFPRTSRHLFFGPDGQLIVPTGGRGPAEGRRSWEGALRAISRPERVTDRDRLLAEGLFRARMGDLTRLSWLKGCWEAPIEVLWDARTHLLALSPLKPRSGVVISIVPLHRARPGWEVERFIGARKRHQSVLGAFWQSSGEAVRGGEIPPGLLHGLVGNLRLGTPYYSSGDFFYLSGFWRADADLVMTAGVSRSGEGWLEAKFLLFLVQAALVGLIILLALVLLPQRPLLPVPQVSLGTKFLIATAVLGGVPLITMMIANVRQIHRLSQSVRQELENRLERRVASLEQISATTLAELEIRLGELVQDHRLDEIRSNRQLEDFLKELEPLGLVGHMLIRRDGTTFTRTSFAADRERSTEALFFSLIRPTLKKAGFDVAKTEKTILIPAELQLGGIEGLESNVSPLINRLQSLEVGGDPLMTFGGFRTDNQGTPVSFLNMLFSNAGVMRRAVVTSLRGNPPGDGLFLRPLFPGCPGREPRNPQVRVVVDVAAATLQGTSLTVVHRGTPYLVFCRPLKGVDAIATVVQRTGPEKLRRLRRPHPGENVTQASPTRRLPWATGPSRWDERDREARTNRRMRQCRARATDGPSLARRAQSLGAVDLLRFPLSAILFQGLLIAIACLVAMLAARHLRRHLLEPLMELAAAFTRVREGDYQVSVTARCHDELGALAGRFNGMVDGLRQKAAMTSFLRPELIRQTTARPVVRVGRERLAIMFAGMRGFRSLEADLSPEAAMALMNDFHRCCQEVIQRHGGEVDKFIGDTTMAVFPVAPAAVPLSPVAGASPGGAGGAPVFRAACELNVRLERWRSDRLRSGSPAPEFGIGFAQGPVVAGHIGSVKKRMDFTVIGDTVNLAARLEKLAGSGEFPAVLGTSDLEPSVPPGFRIRELPLRSVRGRTGSARIFTVERAAESREPSR